MLTDFNLQLAGGEKVGLVGPSGAGKSTITKLLLRLYDVKKRLDQDRRAEYRRRYSRQPARSHRIRAAGANFVPPQPAREHPLWPPRRQRGGGYRGGKKSPLPRIHFGSAGGIQHLRGRARASSSPAARGSASLSLGQYSKTRLFWCSTRRPRASTPSPRRSSKTRSRRLCKARRLSSSRTALSTIMKMDRIIVLEGGRIIAQGTHDELLKEGRPLPQALEHPGGRLHRRTR